MDIDVSTEIVMPDSGGGVCSNLWLHGFLANEAGTDLVTLTSIEPDEGVSAVVVRVSPKRLIRAIRFVWRNEKYGWQGLIVAENDNKGMAYASGLFSTKGKI